MPAFPNPFSGNINRKVSKEELLQALRIDIASELEAIYLYEAHAEAADDPLVKKVLRDIRDEEKAHVGELMALTRYLDPHMEEFLTDGEAEVKEVMEDLGIKEGKLPENGTQKSVGSLIEQ